MLLHAEFHHTLFELVSVERDEHDLIVFVGLQRAVGNHHHVLQDRRDDLHVGEHSRLQTPVGLLTSIRASTVRDSASTSLPMRTTLP